MDGTIHHPRIFPTLLLFCLKDSADQSYTSSQMKSFIVLLALLLLLFPLAVLALEPTSPGLHGNLKSADPLAASQRSLTIAFWHRSPTSSLGLVDAVTGVVSWQPLQTYRASDSPDRLFPCRFRFRCSIENRTIKYCNVTTDNRASYRVNIDVDGLVHVSVDGPGRQSVSFEAEGLRKRIHVYGRSRADKAWCGIEP